MQERLIALLSVPKLRQICRSAQRKFLAYCKAGALPTELQPRGTWPLTCEDSTSGDDGGRARRPFTTCLGLRTCLVMSGPSEVERPHGATQSRRLGTLLRAPPPRGDKSPGTIETYDVRDHRVHGIGELVAHRYPSVPVGRGRRRRLTASACSSSLSRRCTPGVADDAEVIRLGWAAGFRCWLAAPAGPAV